MKIKHYQPLTYITYSIVGITVLAGILLSCNIPIFPGISVNGSTLATTQTKTTSTNAAIRVKSTCSMTATIDSGNEHTATMINGQYKEDIGLTTITTFCNDPNGYAIYAIGYTGGDTGVAAGTNTLLHSNVLGSTYDIITGTSTNGLDNNDTSNWAMKLTALGTTDTYRPDILNGYNNFSLVPQDYTKVASYNTATDLDNPASTRLGSNLTTTYAAYISNTQPAGTYEGQVKYVLVHPASNPGPYIMQDVEDWGSTIAVGQEATAYDIRDNRSYTVRRMCMEGYGDTWQGREANCTGSMLWMTQNLDLDLDGNTELTSEDTDLNVVDSKAYTDGYTQDQFGVIHWTPATTTITNINTSAGKFTGWVSSLVSTYSADPDGGNSSSPWYATGIYFQSDLCYKNNNNRTCNYLKSDSEAVPEYFQRAPFATNGNHGKVGNYYNWSAAIASNDSSGYNTGTYNNIFNNPKNSICPRGWRLPRSSIVGTNNDFVQLNSTYNFINEGDDQDLDQGLLSAPVYMIRSGNVVESSVDDAGRYGYYWSSTVSNAYSAYVFKFSSNSVSSGSLNYRRYGNSVRCVSDY